MAHSRHLAPLLLSVVVVGLLGACSSDKTSTPSSTDSSTVASSAPGATANGTGSTDKGASCSATTASADQTALFTFTHTRGNDGFSDDTTASFAHVKGVTVTAAAGNDGPITVTITDANKATIATIKDIAPGVACGIDHDFAPGDYFIDDNHGNGTQFTSFPDKETTATTGGSSAAPSAGGSGDATLTVNGKTYTFTGGGCSDVLDPNQFLYRSPSAPGADATYFALTVTDVTATSNKGGKHAGSVTYQDNNNIVVSVSDATLDIAGDLSSGTFSGSDYITHVPVTGAYSC